MPGRFKLDENLPQGAEAVFYAGGHDVDTVLGERLGGERDPTVFAAAKNENRILVTLDLDFADIRSYPPSSSPGIWVLRPHSQSVENVLSLLKGVLAVLGTEDPSNHLWIVEPGRVRIHE